MRREGENIDECDGGGRVLHEAECTLCNVHSWHDNKHFVLQNNYLQSLVEQCAFVVFCVCVCVCCVGEL